MHLKYPAGLQHFLVTHIIPDASLETASQSLSVLIYPQLPFCSHPPQLSRSQPSPPSLGNLSCFSHTQPCSCVPIQQPKQPFPFLTLRTKFRASCHRATVCFLAVLEIELRALRVPAKPSVTELYPWPENSALKR